MNERISQLSKDEMYINEQIDKSIENQDENTQTITSSDKLTKVKETIETLKKELKELNIKNSGLKYSIT